MGTGSFLVDPIHQAPVPAQILGLRGFQVVAGEIDNQSGVLFLPVAQQCESEILVHEPIDFEIGVGFKNAGTALFETIVDLRVVVIMAPPRQTELTLCDALGTEPAVAHFAQPPNEGG